MEGEDGFPPAAEKVPGYTFKQWRGSDYYTNVKKSYVIYGKYYTGDVKTYKVEFVDYDGRMLYAPQYIASGQDADRPNSPKRDGYTFVGWDNQRFCIRKDTVITAQYREGDLKTYFLQYKGRCPDKEGPYNLLKEEWIVEGEDGFPPAAEKVPGYTFKQWRGSDYYTNVKKSYVIYGEYYTGDVKTYKVEFVDYDGRMLYAPQYITEGGRPSVPSTPSRDGYTFIGWDKEFYQITSPTKIRAVYIPVIHNTHKVMFYGKITGVQSWVVLKEEHVPTGYDASAPIPPAYAGYVFTGWGSSYTNIQSNKSIFAKYTPEDSVTGANKLRIYKSLLSKLDLSDELEDALIELGEYLANADGDEPASRSLVIGGELIILVATLIYACGAYLARPLFEGIANCITTCFGRAADSVVDAIEDELETLISEGGSDAEITSDDVDWNVDSNLQHHVANGSNGNHREPWRKFGLDPDDPKFYSTVLPFLKKVVDEGEKYREQIVPEGKVLYYIKNFAEKGQEIIVKIFVNNDGTIKTLSDAYVNTK